VVDVATTTMILRPSQLAENCSSGSNISGRNSRTRDSEEFSSSNNYNCYSSQVKLAIVAMAAVPATKAARNATVEITTTCF